MFKADMDGYVLHRFEIMREIICVESYWQYDQEHGLVRLINDMLKDGWRLHGTVLRESDKWLQFMVRP